MNNDRMLAIDSLNLSINKGEFVSIIGPSGCGKTTILRLIAGLLKPTNGSVTIDGKGNRLSNKKFSIVFQKPMLLPWRNVFDNVKLPAEIDKKIPLDSIHEKINLVGLYNFKNHYPDELSGGMQQRVSLARALVVNSDLLLLDEPFSSLDEMSRNELNIELLEIHRNLRPTVIFITHSITESVFLSDRIIILTDRPAKIKAIININLPVERSIDQKETVKFQEYVKCIRNKLTA